MKLIRKLIQRLQEERGVTLIELLAVIVILGIIAAIGIPAVMDSRAAAQEEVYKTNAQILEEAAKRKILLGEKYDPNNPDAEDSFNLEELLTEADIARGDVSEGSAGDDVNDASDAIAFVDEEDESKGTYLFNVAEGTVTYEPDYVVEESVEESTEEVNDESGSDEGTEDESGTESIQRDAPTLDVPREPVQLQQ